MNAARAQETKFSAELRLCSCAQLTGASRPLQLSRDVCCARQRVEVYIYFETHNSLM